MSHKSSLRYHLIGIGGIGMAGLASLLLSRGHRVSGSDQKDNVLTRRLKEQGAVIYQGHEERYVLGADIVVYSSAIAEDNPERQAARRYCLPTKQRAEVLASLMKDQTSVTVAGAHGKTTTASLVTHLFRQAGLSPTSAVGGILVQEETNAWVGEGRYFIAEVDESDGTFLFFEPDVSVITNLDWEHVDFYGNWENLEETFRKFIHKTRSRGQVIVCGDDRRLRRLVHEVDEEVVTYGFGPENDLRAQNIFNPHGGEVENEEKIFCRFDALWKGRSLGGFDLAIPGTHNIFNALACLAVGLRCGISEGIIREAIRSFPGVRRRFQRKTFGHGVMIVDDYAHHPTEIRAVLQTARALQPKRLVAVVQPHRYSRLKLLWNDFIRAFQAADELFITDVYAASEQPLPDVSAQALCEAVAQAGGRARYVERAAVVPTVLEEIKEGDLVLTLGAGDITQTAQELAEAWTGKHEMRNSTG